MNDEIKKYRKALEKIALTRKVESMGMGTQDNSYEVEIAREALGMPRDIPEIDEDY